MSDIIPDYLVKATERAAKKGLDVVLIVKKGKEYASLTSDMDDDSIRHILLQTLEVTGGIPYLPPPPYSN